MFLQYSHTKQPKFNLHHPLFYPNDAKPEISPSPPASLLLLHSYSNPRWSFLNYTYWSDNNLGDSSLGIHGWTRAPLFLFLFILFKFKVCTYIYRDFKVLVKKKKNPKKKKDLGPLSSFGGNNLGIHGQTMPPIIMIIIKLRCAHIFIKIFKLILAKKYTPFKEKKLKGGQRPREIKVI